LVLSRFNNDDLEIAASKVLVPSGFPEIVAFVSVNKDREDEVVAVWKRAIDLVLLNESKLVVSRAPLSSGGGLQFSKFTLKQSSQQQ
jgi:hypothetical protein